MRITIATDAGRARVWHHSLAEALAACGHEISFAEVPVADQQLARVLRHLDLLLRAETRLYRVPGDHAFARFTPSLAAAAPPDLTLDLSSAGTTTSPGIFPLFNGERGERGQFATLVNRQSPDLAIHTSDGGDLDLSGLPAIENRQIASFGLAHLAMATVALLLKAVAQRGPHGNAKTAALAHAPASAVKPLFFGASMLGTKILHNLGKVGRRTPAWHVAWRRTHDDAIQNTGQWPQGHFTPLPDDGLRYFADPFVFVQDGVHHVFCEEFPYDTGIGVISHFTLDRHSRASPVRRVLEQPYHLSYPQVFAYEGAIYMLPETSANRDLQLYRARNFPDDWVLEKVLIEDIDLADATFITHGGRCWIFATPRLRHGSSWDQLALFHAPHPLGPWTAHPENPVILDAGRARPGGQMWVKDGRIHRVAQDCSGSYGGSLRLLRVDEIDATGFRQSEIARIVPPPTATWRGLHTLNCAGDFEVIDYFA